MHFGSVNVVLLYGREACAGFGELLTYWDAMLSDADWAKFIFVILDENKPNLPKSVASKVGNSCLWSRKPGIADVSEIVSQIMIKMALAPAVLLQCMCSVSPSDCAVGIDAPISVVMQLKKHFETVKFEHLLYLLLANAPELRLAQRKLTDNMLATKPTAAYMVTTVNQYSASVPAATVMRAVHAEALANAANLRSLVGSLYSLGYSTLNANNRELYELLAHKACQTLEEKSAETPTREDAWQTISGQRLDHWTDGSIKHSVKDWLKKLVDESVKPSLPDANARNTARILICAYNRPPEECKQLIKQFFMLNTGTRGQIRERMEKLAEETELAICRRLKTRINAGAFPTDVIDRLCEELDKQVQSEPASQPIHLPKRTLRDSLHRNGYIDKCCEMIERACEQELPLEYIPALASALKRRMLELKAFISNAKSLNTWVADQRLPPDRFEMISSKYSRYDHALDEAFSSQTIELSGLLRNNKIGLYQRNGFPVTDAFPKLRDSVIGLVTQSIPSQYQSSFYQALALEFSGDGQLDAFFSKYLTVGERMFNAINDAPGVSSSVYFADIAFTSNPWVKNQPNVHLVKNDNIERIDLYALHNPIDSYLSDPFSMYFAFEGGERKEGLNHDDEAFQVLGGSQAVTPGEVQTWHNDGQSNAASQEHDANTEHDDSRHLAIERNTDGQYVLTWDWKQMADSASIHLFQNGRSIGLMTVKSVQYNAPVGSSPQGIDVSEYLKAVGPVEVWVQYNGVLYASETVAGRQNGVWYHAVRDNRDGTITLNVRGALSDIRKTVLRSFAGGRVVLYPMSAMATPQSYSGIRLPGEWELTPTPMEQYPTIYTVRE